MFRKSEYLKSGQLLGLSLALSMGALGLVACGDSNPQEPSPGVGQTVNRPTQPGSNPVPSPTATPTASPTPRIGTGALLFQTTKSAADLTRDRDTFMTSMKVGRPYVAPFNLYTVNNRYVAYERQAYAPVVFGYFNSTTEVRFTAKFSDDFRNQLPAQMIQTISENDVDTLDIFFAPQKYDGKGFKPHAWAWDPQAAPFVGTIHSGNLSIAIYDSEVNIDQDIRTNQLTSWGFSIHDDTLSPVQPELNITPTTVNFAFWSLVIDPTQRKAAATLHWILSAQNNFALSTILGIHYSAVATGGGSFRDIVDQLRGDMRFQGTPMMLKLDAFTQ